MVYCDSPKILSKTKVKNNQTESLLGFTLTALVILGGAGAPILRDNHKREERSAAKRLILSPLLRFSLRLSFLITPLSLASPPFCFFVRQLQ